MIEDPSKTDMEGIMEQVKGKLAPILEKYQVIPKEPELAHLGGYVIGGDDATWYPDLWKWLVDRLEVTTVLDVGCGDGVALRYFRDVLGCQAIGVDGLKQDDPDIVQIDFTKESFEMTCDLAWCCEVVEHVPELKIRNLLNAFSGARYVAMTHAEPGQVGHHHVNCQRWEYWRGALAVVGFEYDDVLTKCARIAASINTNPWNHFKRSGLVFKKIGLTNPLH